MVSLATRLGRLEAHYAGYRPAGPRTPPYQDRPVAYCREVLGVSLTPQQEAVCAAVAGHGQVLVSSANEVGKSFLAACLALWHYDCWNPGLTIVTGPNAEVFRDTIFAEMRTLR